MVNDIAPSARAGQYVRQISGYSAFVPKPLPPEPPVKMGQSLHMLLSSADLALGRLDGAMHVLPNPDCFMQMYVRKEAVQSSQIEGTQSSLRDVLDAEAKILAPNQPQDANEVIHYVTAMNHGLERLTELPVAMRLIREIHAKLLHGARNAKHSPGEIRTSQNWIGHRGGGLHEAIFVPPPPDVLQDALGDWEKFINAPGEIPALIWIGLAHAQFETIHPFLDGNGRIGRLLITLLLCQQKILRKPVLYLSLFFNRHREDYYARLQSVHDHGDWEAWLAFFLRGVAEISKEAENTAQAVLALREKHRQAITEHCGRAAGNGYRVLEHLYASPIVSVPEVQRLIDMTYPAANQLTARMVDCGILQELTGRARNRMFCYQDYINLFHDH